MLLDPKRNPEKGAGIEREVGARVGGDSEDGHKDTNVLPVISSQDITFLRSAPRRPSAACLSLGRFRSLGVLRDILCCSFDAGVVLR